ncbi:DUF4192 family protein [Actinoplanes sp. NPDC049118]|uniref:DUF4192 family protein n=1 Tax=Actinoplanes sp. NPDC049118 TaxID=3155769 RepID=UPI0033E6A644
MTKLKVSSPAELISAVPFLIGFHPADSLTVVAMRGPEIAFAVRADLPELDAPADEAKAAVLHLASVVIRQQVQAVAIIGYGDKERVTPALLRVSDVFRRVGLVIIEELRVEDGRYWSFLCSDPACCPPQGQPCEPPDSVVAAEATFAGAVALPSREMFAAQVTPVTGDDREAMTGATARAVLRLASLAAADLTPEDFTLVDSAPATGQPESVPAASVRPESVPAASVRPESVPAASVRPESVPATSVRPDSETAASGRLESVPVAVAGPDSEAAASAAAPVGVVACPDDSEPDPAAGAAAPMPGQVPDAPQAEPGQADDEVPFLPDQSRFFQRVRQAGRKAVREAERCYRSGGRLTDDEIAWLGLLLLHVPVRDYAWTRTRTAEWELALWSDVMRRVEPTYTPAPASLLAFVAWRSGSGVLASVAVERALDEQRDYSLAMLVHQALVNGVHPAVLDGWPAVAGAPEVPRDPDEDSEDGPEPHAHPDREAPGHAEPADHPQRADRSEWVEPPERTSHASRSPRAERADRAERSTRAERVDRAERSTHDRRLDPSEWEAHAQRSTRAEPSTCAERADPADRSTGVERSTHDGRLEPPEREAHAQRSTRAERSPRAERSKRAERVDRAGRSTRADGVDGAGRAGHVERSTRLERAGHAERDGDSEAPARSAERVARPRIFRRATRHRI